MIRYQGRYYNPCVIVEEGDRLLGNFKLIGDNNPKPKGLLVRTYRKGSLVKFERIKPTK